MKLRRIIELLSRLTRGRTGCAVEGGRHTAAWGGGEQLTWAPQGRERGCPVNDSAIFRLA